MTSDKELLRIYMRGFNDELDGRQLNIPFTDPVEECAYNHGRDDALTGDDVTSNDEQSDEEILYHIKKKFGNVK